MRYKGHRVSCTVESPKEALSFAEKYFPVKDAQKYDKQRGIMIISSFVQFPS